MIYPFLLVHWIAANSCVKLLAFSSHSFILLFNAHLSVLLNSGCLMSVLQGSKHFTCWVMSFGNGKHRRKKIVLSLKTWMGYKLSFIASINLWELCLCRITMRDYKEEEFKFLFLMDGFLPLIVLNLFYKLCSFLRLSYVVSRYQVM